MPSPATARVRAILKRFGSYARVAELIGIPSGKRVSDWGVNGHIPSYYWPQLLRAAEQHDIELTLDELAALSGDRAAHRLGQGKAA